MTFFNFVRHSENVFNVHTGINWKRKFCYRAKHSDRYSLWINIATRNYDEASTNFRTLCEIKSTYSRLKFFSSHSGEIRSRIMPSIWDLWKQICINGIRRVKYREKLHINLLESLKFNSKSNRIVFFWRKIPLVSNLRPVMLNARAFNNGEQMLEHARAIASKCSWMEHFLKII